MYSTKDKLYNPRLVTANQVLSRISCLELFKYYCKHDFILGKAFKSPLRADRNPSFVVYETTKGLRFKDFSEGVSGNIFEFLKLRYSCTYREAVNIICKDFGISSDGSSVKQVQIIQQSINTSRKITTIKIKKRPWNDDLDQDYWYKKHGLHRATLDYFNVIPISHYWINDSRTYIVSEHSPAYAYRLARGKYKILWPYEQKSRKWLNNASRDLYQGFRQIPESGNLLIITKALKDVMCLYQAGIPAIAPGGEGEFIPENLVNSLKKRFKHIIVWYDNDVAGEKAAAKLSTMYNLTKISLPVDCGCKDPAEFYGSHGQEKFKSTVNILINGLTV